jgi:hypothetical protein
MSSSNKTPPPNPELEDAQINGINSSAAATEAMTAAQMALVPYQIEQMKFGLMAANTAYKDSREDRKYSLERRGHLTGLQDRMISDAESFSSADKQNEMAMSAMADAGTQLDAEKQAQMRSRTRMGLNPNSGNMDALSNQMSLGSASIKTSAANNARTQARQEGYSLTDRATSALSGYPTFGANATQQSLNNGVSGLNTVNQTSGAIQSGYNAIGSGAARTGSMAGNLYGQQMNAYNTGQQVAAQEESNVWGAVGTAAAMYGGYLMFSDEDIKEDREKVDPELSLSMIRNIPDSESWRYKADSQAADGGRKHVGPMAQDVRASMGEDVAPGGKAIDIVSMNGHTLNAIKALDKKVDKALSLSQVTNKNRKG